MSRHFRKRRIGHGAVGSIRCGSRQLELGGRHIQLGRRLEPIELLEGELAVCQLPRCLLIQGAQVLQLGRGNRHIRLGHQPIGQHLPRDVVSLLLPNHRALAGGKNGAITRQRQHLFRPFNEQLLLGVERSLCRCGDLLPRGIDIVQVFQTVKETPRDLKPDRGRVFRGIAAVGNLRDVGRIFRLAIHHPVRPGGHLGEELSLRQT